MAAEKSPAFQLYVNEFRSSRSVQRMTFAERGMYLEMLMEQWQSFTLPDDAEQVAGLISTSEGQHAEVIAAWPTLRRKFVTVDRQPGRIVNVKMEKVRRDRRKFLSDRRKAGREGGIVSGRRRKETKALTLKQNEAQLASSLVLAVAKGTSSSSSSTASSSSSSTATTVVAPSNRGRGIPPLAMGLQRVKIWRWMIEDLMGRLGEHADEFDLEAWIQERDRNETRVHTGEWWDYWLQAFESEIRLRGLPVVAAPVAILSKRSSNLLSAVAGMSNTR